MASSAARPLNTKLDLIMRPYRNTIIVCGLVLFVGGVLARALGAPYAGVALVCSVLGGLGLAAALLISARESRAQGSFTATQQSALEQHGGEPAQLHDVDGD
jgi:hypothetical protein